MSEKKEKSSKLTAVQKKLIIGIVCALLGLLLIGGGIYCGGTDQNPKEAVVGLFTPRDQAICANWDSQDKPGVLAFVFYSDGTCDRYISTWNFDCEYTIKGNKLTIEDADTKKTLDVHNVHLHVFDEVFLFLRWVFHIYPAQCTVHM